MGSLARPDQRSIGVVDPNAAATDLRAVQDEIVGSARHRIRRYPCGATAGRPVQYQPSPGNFPNADAGEQTLQLQRACS